MKSNYNFLKGLVIGVFVILTTGCLVTKPYWNYKVDNTASDVYLEAFTQYAGSDVKVECATYNPYSSPRLGEYWHVTNITPNEDGLTDKYGNMIYLVNETTPLPLPCWSMFMLHGRYARAAAIRFTQVVPTSSGKASTRTFASMNDKGVACVGAALLREFSWFSFLGDGCTETYVNTNENVPYVVISAKNA